MSMPNDPHGYGPPSGYSYPPPGGYPTYPGQYSPYPVEPPQDPDNGLGIAGLVLSVVGLAPIGLILSWIALNNSKRRGYKNTVALIGAIVGGALTALIVLVIVVYVVFFLLFLGILFSADRSLLF